MGQHAVRSARRVSRPNARRGGQRSGRSGGVPVATGRRRHLPAPFDNADRRQRAVEAIVRAIETMTPSSAASAHGPLDI